MNQKYLIEKKETISTYWKRTLSTSNLVSKIPVVITRHRRISWKKLIKWIFSLPPLSHRRRSIFNIFFETLKSSEIVLIIRTQQHFSETTLRHFKVDLCWYTKKLTHYSGVTRTMVRARTDNGCCSHYLQLYLQDKVFCFSCPTLRINLKQNRL